MKKPTALAVALFNKLCSKHGTYKAVKVKGLPSREFTPATFDELKTICADKGMEQNKSTNKADLVAFYYGAKPEQVENLQEETTTEKK